MHHLIASIMGRKMSEDRHKKAKAEEAAKNRPASRGDKSAGKEEPSGEALNRPAD